MDPNLLPEISQLLKAGSPWVAGCAVCITALQIAYKLIAPRFYADAVRRTTTKEEKDALVELFRLANPPKQVRGAQPIRKPKR